MSFFKFHFELSSNLSDAGKRKKSISVINLAVGDKFSSFSLRRKSTSFLDLSGKENTDDVNDDSSIESEEESDSFPRSPPIPPVRTSSLEEPVRTNSLKTPKKPKRQIPIPAPRKISSVSLPAGRLARLGLRLCKFAFVYQLHHLTSLLFTDPRLDQSFILPEGPQLQYQMRPQQILSI